MSMIRLPIRYVGSLGETNLMTLFDNESTMSCINPESIKSIALPELLGVLRHVATAKKGHFIEVNNRVHLQFFIGDVMLSDEFFLIPNLYEQVVLGSPTMRKWRIKLDFENNAVHVNPSAAILRI